MRLRVLPYVTELSRRALGPVIEVGAKFSGYPVVAYDGGDDVPVQPDDQANGAFCGLNLRDIICDHVPSDSVVSPRPGLVVGSIRYLSRPVLVGLQRPVHAGRFAMLS